jgi:hypothetical protein
MRWRVLTKSEKLAALIQAKCAWHKWFAWYPVRVVDPETGHTLKVWLEYVGRKMKVYDYMADEFVSKETVGRPLYCFEEDLVYNALANNDLIDLRDGRRR